MTRRDGALVVLASGAVMLWIGLTEVLYRYLRPSMQRWVVLSALALIVLGVAMFVTELRAGRFAAGPVDDDHGGHDDHDHGAQDGHDSHDGHDHRPSRVGWFLLAPLLIALVVSPTALGAYAVDRASASRVPTLAPFDLAEHLRVSSFGGQDVELDLYQLYSASADEGEQDLLADVPLRVQGFIVHDSGQVLLARLVVGCCAGDALPMVAVLEGDLPAELTEDDTWVEVHATYDADAGVVLGDSPDAPTVPVLRVSSMEAIEEPDLPYLYPS